MAITNEDKFIGNIRTALGHDPDRRRTPSHDLFTRAASNESRQLLKSIKRRSNAEKAALLKILKSAAEPLNMEVVSVDAVEEATGIITEKVSKTDPEWGGGKQVCMWRHPLTDRLELPAALGGKNIQVVSTDSLSDGANQELTIEQRTVFRQGVINSFIGVTAADYCVAESATLVLPIHPGQPRSISLVPSIHIAVITIDQIMADFSELYALLRWGPHGEGAELDNCLSFISGPSKTADIEATLVHGAHGPRELILIVSFDGAL